MDQRLHVDGSRPASVGNVFAPADSARQSTESLDVAAVMDTDGTITAVSPAWHDLLGQASNEAVGRSILDLVHPDDVAPTRAALEQVGVGRNVRGCVNRLLHTDGEWRWFSWSAALSQGTGLVHVSGRDVTEGVQADAAAVRAAGDVETALAAERARCERLEEHVRRQEVFVSAVSHELQAPLTMVRGAAETLADQHGGLTSDEVAELQDLIVCQADRLATVLDEFLELGRMNRGELTARRRPAELVALARDAIARSAAAGRIELVAPEELPVHVDPVQVEHILDNLLANAAKYAPDGDIVVTLVREHDRVRIAVLDQGPGIPASALDQVFEPFWRVDDDHPMPGTGVGLALVAEFARLHGGRTWVEPQTGGAHLVVELPADDS